MDFFVGFAVLGDHNFPYARTHNHISCHAVELKGIPRDRHSTKGSGIIVHGFGLTFIQFSRIYLPFLMLRNSICLLMYSAKINALITHFYPGQYRSAERYGIFNQ